MNQGKTLAYLFILIILTILGATSCGFFMFLSNMKGNLDTTVQNNAISWADTHLTREKYDTVICDMSPQVDDYYSCTIILKSLPFQQIQCSCYNCK